MRKNQEIIKQAKESFTVSLIAKLIIEILLDIRTLLIQDRISKVVLPKK